MSFDINKHKASADHGSMWTSYSDLFLGLSIIFLLLYVAASLRQGTDGMQQAQEMQRMASQIEDLKQQLKVYDTLKQNYVETGATQEEQATYNELMNKLNLLKDEAKAEKDKLRQEATENERKENALNKYQQLVRNIINSNMVSQARIRRRDTIIEKKDDVIAENKAEIAQLDAAIEEDKAKIEQGERKIKTAEERLDARVRQLRQAYKAQQISKKKFDQESAQIRQETQRRVEALRAEKAQTEAQLSETSDKLASTNTQLASTSNKLEATASQLRAAGQEKERLSEELKGLAAKSAAELAQMKGDLEAKNAAQVDGLKGQFEAQRAKDRAEFEGELGREKLSSAARAAREAQFRADADRKAKELGDKIAGMNGRLQATQQQLARAQENLNARKRVADQIKKSFAAGGIAAEVDADTGDVMLSFGNQYFQSGHAELQPGMREILVKAMPAYSSSLFGDPKIAEKIQSVEIVGFASPTYQGRYIDPSSLSQTDRKAVNYNLDLSYQRARAIFNYAFDTDKMTFKHQKQMLPLVKVTGRSFLAEGQGNGKSRVPADSDKSCDKGDCAKARRVIIKFTLKD
jgi:chromosome segregation ATPase